MEHHHGHTDGPGHGEAHGPTHGVHGMLVLGSHRMDDGMRSPVYVSHLPMFMAPHDFQVIIQVTGDAALKFHDFVAHFGTSGIYTFQPEPFSIVELDRSRGGSVRTSFSGRLFRGHFERGGSEIARDVSFEVEHVVHFRRFEADSASTTESELRYLCFGERDAAFLAHLVTKPPDFDQILAIDVSALSGVPDEELRAGAIVTAPGRANGVETRLQENDAFSDAIAAEGTQTPGSIDLTVADEYYLETGDLAAAM